jgi:hypothetical protein
MDKKVYAKENDKRKQKTQSLTSKRRKVNATH